MLRRTSPQSTHSAPMGTGMKRNSAIETRKLSRVARVGRKAGALVAAAATLVAVMAAAKPAAAQEIQLTGPLAGAPSVRKLRLYRQGRFEIAPGIGQTLLDEYNRTTFVTLRLQYNIFDFLGIGIYGGFGAINSATDLTDKIQSTSPRNTRTAINVPALNGPSFADQTAKLKYMVGPQITFSPFRGKLAVFQKLFVDTDLYVHVGGTAVGVEERKDCTACTVQSSFATTTRTAFAPTFGLGLTFYTHGLVSVNIEYRAFPLLSGSNRGGFDSRGGGPDGNFPDNKIDSSDRTFKFNQMVGLSVGFSLPSAPKLSE
jgi:outer membrane beta-barrel protein